MRRHFSTAAVTALSLALFGFFAPGCGCEDPGSEIVTGTLTIGVETRSEKTIWPQDWLDSIGEYDVLVFDAAADLEIDAPLFSALDIPAADVGDPVVFEDVLYGSYVIVVRGSCLASPFCDDHDTIAFGMADAIDVAGEDPVQVAVTVYPFVEEAVTGAMEITLEWPAGAGVDLVEIDRMMVDEADWSLAQSSGGLLVHADLLFEDPSAAAGSHMLRFRLYGDGADPALDDAVATAIEVVNVYSNYKTVGTITLTEDDFIDEPVEPDPDGYDLTVIFDDWADAGDQSLHFPHTGNWDLAGAPILDFPAGATSGEITIEHASDEDGLVEFQVLNEQDWGSCWSFDAWTRDGVALDAGNTCQVVVDCTGIADLIEIDVFLDVGAGTITGNCVVPHVDPDTSSIEVTIVPEDFVPEQELEIECQDAGDDFACSPSVVFSPGAIYQWYLNGVRLIETTDVLVLAKEHLRAGFRLALAVIDPPMAQSAQLTFTADFIAGVVWTYVVDFEGAGETKTVYSSGTVNLSGLDWDMTEALIGTLAEDFRNGARSARLRGYGTSVMTMLEDKSDGLGSITFEYRRYGTDTQADWRVEYSTDGGLSWQQIGADFTAPGTDEVQTFHEEVNVSGDVRVRIKRATESGEDNRRLNVDDIKMSDHP